MDILNKRVEVQPSPGTTYTGTIVDRTVDQYGTAFYYVQEDNTNAIHKVYATLCSFLELCKEELNKVEAKKGYKYNPGDFVVFLDFSCKLHKGYITEQCQCSHMYHILEDNEANTARYLVHEDHIKGLVEHDIKFKVGDNVCFIYGVTALKGKIAKIDSTCYEIVVGKRIHRVPHDNVYSKDYDSNNN